jgi:hypothetical protein
MTHIMNWSTTAILGFNAMLLIMSLSSRIKKAHGIGGVGRTSDKECNWRLTANWQ